MRVLAWGLGYVGTVSAACLAQLGHEVVGVEPNLTKVEALNAGRYAIKEPDLDELVSQMVEVGRLRATQDGVSLVPWADISLICVGTPAAADGSPVLDYVRNVAMDIGRGLQETTHYHVVVLRSTVFPGTMRQVLSPLFEEHSGRQAGRDFGVAMHPEFMRETNAINDFYTPPYTIIGELDTRSGDQLAALYRLSFKPNTDDLRASPIIDLIRELWQDGVDVLVYDPDVHPETMLGSNREYLERQLPQIHQILCPHIAKAFHACQVVIVSQKRPELTLALQVLDGHATVLDLVRAHEDLAALGVSKYRGMSW